MPLTWIKQRLSDHGLTIEQLVQSESQQLATDQVSISNSLNSLRLLGAVDWREFVEQLSVVEQILCEDPAGVYPKMDFLTRDRYRHVVEKLAKSSGLSESEVARKAIHLAHEAAERKGNNNRTAHVGFYIIDKGLTELERIAKVRLSPLRAFQRMGRKFALFFYLGTITLTTLAFTGVLLSVAYNSGLHDWLFALIGILSLLCSSHIAVAMANWLATLMSKPHVLPRMDFSKGIPSESSTLAVIPSMLTGVQNIKKLLEALEVRYLANQDKNLYFGLLTDFRDAHTETMPDDEMLLELAREGITDLNDTVHADGILRSGSGWVTSVSEGSSLH
jgi:hypothetical protein